MSYFPYKEDTREFKRGDRIRISCETHPHFNNIFFVEEARPGESTVRATNGWFFFKADIEAVPPWSVSKICVAQVQRGQTLIIEGSNDSKIIDCRAPAHGLKKGDRVRVVSSDPAQSGLRGTVVCSGEAGDPSIHVCVYLDAYRDAAGVFHKGEPMWYANGKGLRKISESWIYV